MGEFTPSVCSRWSQPPSPRGRQPSQALPRQLSQRESQAVKSVAKVFGVMRRFPAVLLALPLGELPSKARLRGRSRGQQKSTAHSQARICGAPVQIIVTSRCGSHRGCSSASSSCRRTSPRCRTQPPSPARSWPWWGRRSTRRYRRGGGDR